jgi:hypothetical protein
MAADPTDFQSRYRKPTPLPTSSDEPTGRVICTTTTWPSTCGSWSTSQPRSGRSLGAGSEVLLDLLVGHCAPGGDVRIALGERRPLLGRQRLVVLGTSVKPVAEALPTRGDEVEGAASASCSVRSSTRARSFSFAVMQQMLTPLRVALGDSAAILAVASRNATPRFGRRLAEFARIRALLAESMRAPGRPEWTLETFDEHAQARCQCHRKLSELAAALLGALDERSLGERAPEALEGLRRS